MRIKLFLVFVITILVCTGIQAGSIIPRDHEKMPGGTIHLKGYPFNPLHGEPLIPETLRAGADHPVRLMMVSGPVSSGWLDALKARGIIFLGFMQDFTYIIYLEKGRETLLASYPEVVWIGDFHPAYKIQQGLLDRAGPFEVNIVVFPDLADRMKKEKVLESIRSLGGKITSSPGRSQVIRAIVKSADLYRLAALPQVCWIDRYDPPVALMDNIKKMCGASACFKGRYSGEGIVGEVKDNGCDYKHLDFGSMIGFDGPPTVDDHGTCTYGIVFSTGAKNLKAMGMLPSGGGVFCHWYQERTQSIINLQQTWGGLFQSNSWSQGSTDGTYTSYSFENDFCVNTYGVTMLYAGGNSGQTPKSISQDAVAKNVLGVGAIFHKNDTNLENDEWMDGGFGNTPAQGPSADNRIKPDICAPFDQVYTTDVSGEDGYSDSDYYSSFGGTSAATPIVAGVVGLTCQMYSANHFGNNPLGVMPDNATVKALVINHAYQYDMSRAIRYCQGWGLADAGRMYDVGEEQFITGYPLQTGESHLYAVRSFGYDEPVKFTLVWDDLPAFPPVTRALINDLDLTVIASDGMVYHGNAGLVGYKYSLPGYGPDRRNNVENVFLYNPPGGDFLIEIKGYNIALDNHSSPGVNQKYSLVASRVEQVENDLAPFLFEQEVEPPNGFMGQLFEYTVNYIDPDGDAPTIMNIVLNDQEYAMTLMDGSPSNGTYYFATRDLIMGNMNRHYFYAEDGTGRSRRFPATGSFSGPTVHAPYIGISGDPVPGGTMELYIYSVPGAQWGGAWSSENGPWTSPFGGLTLDIGPGDLHPVKMLGQAPLYLDNLGYGIKSFTLPHDVTPGVKYLQAITKADESWAKSNFVTFTVEE